MCWFPRCVCVCFLGVCVCMCLSVYLCACVFPKYLCASESVCVCGFPRCMRMRASACVYALSYRFSFLAGGPVHGRCHLHLHVGAVGKVPVCGDKRRVRSSEPAEVKPGPHFVPSGLCMCEGAYVTI